MPGRAGSPVPEELVLDLFRLERFLQQGVVLQIDHAKAEVVASAPVGMGFAQGLGAEECSLHGRSSQAVCTNVTLLFNFR